MLNGPGVSQQVQLKPEESQQSGQGRHETGHAESVEQNTVAEPDGGGRCQRHQDRTPHRPVVANEQDGQDRCGQAADRPDGQVDLPDQQYAHHTEGDDPDGHRFQGQVHQVVAGQKDRIEDLEHGPDHDKPDDDRE